MYDIVSSYPIMPLSSSLITSTWCNCTTHQSQEWVTELTVNVSDQGPSKQGCFCIL
uniref:Uncharacterized protein n=1 Tax=Oryza brachyantha TaxID=4533 RepID=J3L429_ORYBR